MKIRMRNKNEIAVEEYNYENERKEKIQTKMFTITIVPYVEFVFKQKKFYTQNHMQTLFILAG